MTMDELRARHVRREALYSQWDAPFCASCHQEWGDHGCDFIRADDERRRLLAVMEAARELGEPDWDDNYCYHCHVFRPCNHDALRAALDEVKR